MQKICRTCRKPRPVSEFPRVFHGTRSPKCESCRKIGPKERPHYQKKGLTTQEYMSMLAYQDNMCAICAGKFTETPHVDHCHKTGRVRGLLCKACNMSLGLLKDDPQRLEAAIKYLSNIDTPGVAYRITI